MRGCAEDLKNASLTGPFLGRRCKGARRSALAPIVARENVFNALSGEHIQQRKYREGPDRRLSEAVCTQRCSSLQD